MIASPVQNALMRLGDEENRNETFLSLSVKPTIDYSDNVAGALRATRRSLTFCWADINVEDDFTEDAMRRSSVRSFSCLSTGTQDFWPENRQVLDYYGLNSTALADFAKTHIQTIAIPQPTTTVTNTAPSIPCDGDASSTSGCPLSLEAALRGVDEPGVNSANLDVPPSISIFDSLAARQSFNLSRKCHAKPCAEPYAAHYNGNMCAPYWYNWN